MASQRHFALATLTALVVVLASTVSAGAQPRQPSPIRVIQSSAGALFLSQEPSAWPLVPDQISDDDLAGFALHGEVNVLPVDPLRRPAPQQRVVQSGDGTLYDIVAGDDGDMDGAWTLVPDQISDAELTGLNIGSEIDGILPSGLGTDMRLAAPTPAVIAPTSAGPTTTANIGTLVGVWEGHLRRIEVHADGSASVAVGSPIGLGSATLDLTLQLRAATPTVATGRVTTSNSAGYPVGEAATLTFNGGDDTIMLALGEQDILGGIFCGPHPPIPGYCGA